MMPCCGHFYIANDTLDNIAKTLTELSERINKLERMNKIDDYE